MKTISALRHQNDSLKTELKTELAKPQERLQDWVDSIVAHEDWKISETKWKRFPVTLYIRPADTPRYMFWRDYYTVWQAHPKDSTISLPIWKKRKTMKDSCAFDVWIGR